MDNPGLVKLDSFSSLISGGSTTTTYETTDPMFGNLEGNMGSAVDQSVLIDELHKVFQYIDKDGRGYLEVSEILNFQAQLADSKHTHS